MAVRTQRVVRPDGSVGVTVIGSDFLPIPAVAEYLDFMRLDGASPNTIRAYARGLALWFDYLDRRDLDWVRETMPKPLPTVTGSLRPARCLWAHSRDSSPRL